MIIMKGNRLPAFIIFSTIFHIFIIAYLKISLPEADDVKTNRTIFVTLVNKENSPPDFREGIKKKIDSTKNKEILKDMPPIYAKNERYPTNQDTLINANKNKPVQLDKTDQGKKEIPTAHEEPKKIENNEVENISTNQKSMNIMTSKKEHIETYTENKPKSFNIEEYEKYILQKIKDMIEYPLLARKRGIEGDILVNVTINTSGELKKVNIVKSSGYSILDDYTISLAGKIKFDVSPPHTIELPLKISYRLNR